MRVPAHHLRPRPMLKLEFTEGEKQALHYERYHHPHPRVQQKLEVLWLKSQGLPHREIARLAGVSENTASAAICRSMSRVAWSGCARSTFAGHRASCLRIEPRWKSIFESTLRPRSMKPEPR